MIFGFAAQYAVCSFPHMLKHMLYTENMQKA
jgi:hypothetical protein